MKDGPASLKELIATEHSGFRLAIGYFVELEHGLWGTFTAIERTTKEPVVTLDFQLLKEVCLKLSPRRHKFKTILLYANLETGVAYSVTGTDEESLGKPTRVRILDRLRFNELCWEKNPFMWAPGLVGDSMSLREFRESLQAAQNAL